MKKLIGLTFALLLSCPVFAGEFKSVIYDNIVNDIDTLGDKIYVATNGGVEVFWKDTSKRFENGLPWKIYTTVNSGLPRNDVRTIAPLNMAGDFYAAGDGWMARKVIDLWQESTTPSVNELVVGPGGMVYGVAEDGLFSVNQDRTRKMISLSFGVTRIAFDCHGVLWGIFKDGIVFSLDTTGNKTVWRCDKELTLGVPQAIAVRNDTVVVVAENGIYTKNGSADWEQIQWPGFGGSDTLFKQKPVSVTFRKAGIIIGLKRDLFIWGSSGGQGGLLAINNPAVFNKVSQINCLVSDGEKLYIGTDDHAWTVDDDISGVKLRQISVTGIHYPCDNKVSFLAKIDSNHAATNTVGQILVSTGTASYAYSNNANAPSFEGSNNYITGGKITSFFVDKDGMLWRGYNDGTLVKNASEWISLPLNSGKKFWLVGDLSKNPWLVTTDSSGNGGGIYVDDGRGVWVNPMNAPANLFTEKIYSVSSTGKRLWIGTDSAVYSYDFYSTIWSRKRLQYSPFRYVAGNSFHDGSAWIADGGYHDGTYSVNYVDINSTAYNWPGSWLYRDRRPNCLFVDGNSTIWVGTDSGTYYLEARSNLSSWQAVLLRDVNGKRTLADDYVNTIYVDSASGAVWIGTPNGLTVWHRPISTSAKPIVKPAIKKLAPQGFSGQKVYDLRGRIISAKNSVAGIKLIQQPNGRFAKTLNFNQKGAYGANMGHYCQ